MCESIDDVNPLNNGIRVKHSFNTLQLTYWSLTNLIKLITDLYVLFTNSDAMNTILESHP